jgi:hypothetical protein
MIFARAINTLEAEVRIEKFVLDRANSSGQYLFFMCGNAQTPSFLCGARATLQGK